MILFPDHSVQCSGLGTRLRGEPSWRKSAAHAVSGRSHENWVSPPFRVSSLCVKLGWDLGMRVDCVGNPSSLFAGCGVTNHVAETLATLCKVQYRSVMAGLTDGICKPLFTCRGFTSSSIQLMSPKGKTPSSSRWLKRQMKVCTIMCVSFFFVASLSGRVPLSRGLVTTIGWVRLWMP